MTMRTLLSCVCGVGLLVLLMTASVDAIAKSGGGGGGGTAIDTTKNVVVVDSSSTPVKVGEVVGANIFFFDGGATLIPLLLNPSLTDQIISPLVQATGSKIYGTAHMLYFTGAGCTGTAIFPYDPANMPPRNNSLLTPITFVEPVDSSTFKLYISHISSSPTSFPVVSHELFNSSYIYSGCSDNVETVTGVPMSSTFTLTLNPPFQLVNP